MTCGFEECVVLSAGDSRWRNPEPADEDAVAWTLPGIPSFRSHPEPAAGYQNHVELLTMRRGAFKILPCSSKVAISYHTELF